MSFLVSLTKNITGYNFLEFKTRGVREGASKITVGFEKRFRGQIILRVFLC